MHFFMIGSLGWFRLNKVHTVDTVKSVVSLKWQIGFENDMKITPIFTIIFISKMLTLGSSHNWNMIF